MRCCTAPKISWDSYLYPDQLTAYDKWIAQYASACTSKHAHGIWQYTGSGKVDGIAGNVDRDVAYKDYPAIIAKMNGQTQKDKLPYTVKCGTFPSHSGGGKPQREDR